MFTNALTDFFNSMATTDRADLGEDKEKRFNRMKLLLCSLCVFDKDVLWESGLLAAKSYLRSNTDVDALIADLDAYMKSDKAVGTTPTFQKNIGEEVSAFPDTLGAVVKEKIGAYGPRNVSNVDPLTHLDRLQRKFRDVLRAVRSVKILGSYKVLWYKGGAQEMIQSLLDKAASDPNAVESVESLGVVNYVLDSVNAYDQDFKAGDTLAKYSGAFTVLPENPAEIEIPCGPYRIPTDITVDYDSGTVPTGFLWDIPASTPASVLGDSGNTAEDQWTFALAPPLTAPPYTLSFRLNNTFYVFSGVTPAGVPPVSTSTLAVSLNGIVGLPAGITFSAGPSSYIKVDLDGDHAVEGMQIQFDELIVLAGAGDTANINEYLQLAGPWNGGATAELPKEDSPPLRTEYTFVADDEAADLRGNGTIEIADTFDVQAGDAIAVRYTGSTTALDCGYRVFSVATGGGLHTLTLTPCADGDPTTPDPLYFDGVPFTNRYIGDVVHDDAGGPNPGVNDSLTSQLYPFVAGDVGKVVAITSGPDAGLSFTIDAVAVGVAYFDPPQELVTAPLVNFYIDEVESVRVDINREDRTLWDDYYLGVNAPAAPEIGIAPPVPPAVYPIHSYASGTTLTLGGDVSSDAPLRDEDAVTSSLSGTETTSTKLRSTTPVKVEDPISVADTDVDIISGLQKGILGVEIPEILSEPSTALDAIRTQIEKFKNQLDASGWESLTTSLQQYMDAIAQLATDFRDLDGTTDRIASFVESLAESGFDQAADIVQRGEVDTFLRLLVEEASRADKASKKTRDLLL